MVGDWDLLRRQSNQPGRAALGCNSLADSGHASLVVGGHVVSLSGGVPSLGVSCPVYERSRMSRGLTTGRGEPREHNRSWRAGGPYSAIGAAGMSRRACRRHAPGCRRRDKTVSDPNTGGSNSRPALRRKAPTVTRVSTRRVQGQRAGAHKRSAREEGTSPRTATPGGETYPCSGSPLGASPWWCPVRPLIALCLNRDSQRDVRSP